MMMIIIIIIIISIINIISTIMNMMIDDDLGGMKGKMKAPPGAHAVVYVRLQFWDVCFPGGLGTH